MSSSVVHQPTAMHSLLPLLLLCASSSLLLLTARTTNADNLTFYMYSNCLQGNTNYTRGSGSGSAFQANLDTILSSLPATAAGTSSGPASRSWGFADEVIGDDPDKVYGLAQCRGDISPEDCLACLSRSAHEMASSSKCEGSKDAVLIYEGCLLRYSNASFFGEEAAADTAYPWYMCDPADKATEPHQFSASLDALMHSLAPRLFAAGSADLSADYEKIYGMVQCRRDLGPDDCRGCLAIAASKIQAYKNCSGIQQGRIFSSSCSIRFGVTPFYEGYLAF